MMLKRFGCFSLVAVLLLFPVGGLFAADADTQPAAAPPLLGMQRLNLVHGYLSTRVETLSQYFDGFFGEQRAYDEANESYLQVRGSVIADTDGLSFEGDFRAKLKLPNLSEKLHLVIENRQSDTEDPTDPRITSGDPSLRQNLEDSELTAGLELVTDELQHWRFSLQPGIRLGELDPTVRFRARRLSGDHAGWQNRLTLSPRWLESSGWQVSTVFDLERVVMEDGLFRSSTQAFWADEFEDNLNLGQLLQLINPIDADQSIAYEVGMSAHTEPHFEDASYFSSVRYRRNIYQGWVYLELKPQLLFARDNSFDPELSLAVTLETLFGGSFLPQAR